MTSALAITVYPPGVEKVEKRQEKWPHGDIFPVEEREESPIPQGETWNVEPSVEHPARLEEKAFVQSLLDPRLRLRHPIEIQIEQEEGVYIAVCTDLEEFGYGYDPTQAIDDLRQTLAELYWTLKAEHSRLSPALRKIWERLQDGVEEVP